MIVFTEELKLLIYLYDIPEEVISFIPCDVNIIIQEGLKGNTVVTSLPIKLSFVKRWEHEFE